MRETTHASIAAEALRMASEKRQRPALRLVRHTDRSVRYAADAYCQALAATKLTPSTSRRGNCLDNAPTESVFHVLKVERAHQRVRASRNKARRNLQKFFEDLSNLRRLLSAPGYRSPVDMQRMAD